jgi:hypothetical protein
LFVFKVLYRLCSRFLITFVRDVYSVYIISELIAGLATDLQQEFYPHLSEFTAVFMSTTLRIQDAGVVKWTLRCLGHLLKILWRPVSGHLAAVYTSLAPIMEQRNPDYMRYLGAETLAFLLRKTRHKTELCQLIVSAITETTDRVAVAKLLLESVKTVNGQFNVGLAKSWPVFLSLFSTAELGPILVAVYRLAAEHTTVDYVDPIVDLTLEKINQTYAESSSSDSDSEVLLACLAQIFQAKKGKLVKSCAKFITFFRQLVHRGGPCSGQLLRCIEQFLRADKIPRTRDEFSQIVELVLESSGFGLEDKLAFVSTLLAETVDDSWLLLRPYLTLVQREHADPDHGGRVLAHLAGVLEERSSGPLCGADLAAVRSNDAAAVLDLQLVPALRQLPSSTLFPSRALSNLADAVADKEHRRSINADQIGHWLAIVSGVKPLADKHAAVQTVSALIQQILAADCCDDTPSSQSSSLVPILPQAIQSLVRLAGGPAIVQSSIDIDQLMQLFLAETAGSLSSLQALNLGLACGLSPAAGVPDAVLSRLVDLLARPDRLARELALHCLTLLLPLLDNLYTQQPDEATPSFLSKCPSSVSSCA